ncbi:type IV pilus modification protein PilV [Chromatiales bacterium (ex Bugula neritina AB1)]|nr:type IV pilus modification protein PilV [Chromatiales bacterium (ex Bugula neritina AB1)]
MIEVLLAVAVLAIGLLAGSKMQMLGLNYTQGAMMRSHATMAVNDIIDRMRVNPDGVSTGAYDNFSTDSAPPAQSCIASTGCDPSDLAKHDLRMFSNYFGKGDADGLSTSIGTAEGTISAPDANGLRIVKVVWKELIKGAEKEREITIGVYL